MIKDIIIHVVGAADAPQGTFRRDRFYGGPEVWYYPLTGAAW